MNLNIQNLTRLLFKPIMIALISCLVPSLSIAQNKDYVEIQNYTIESFSGQPKKITVAYDYDDRLKIIYLNDTLSFYRTYGMDGKAEIINKKFLKITYGYMAGSDMHYERVGIFCIKNNKLCIALLITSAISWDITQVYDRVADSLKLFNEVRNYRIKLKATPDDKLIIDIHDENKSKHDPKTSYNHDYHSVLLFDETNTVFYNKNENLAAYYTVFHPETDIEEKKYIWGTFPVLNIGKAEYYYINGQWYEKGDKNYLEAYSTANVKN